MRVPLLASLATVLLLAAGCTTPPAETTTEPPTTITDSLDVRPELILPEILAPIALGDGVGEPAITAGPNNTVYVADPFMTIWRSGDGGRTYTQADGAGLDGGGDGDLAVDASGRLHWLGLGGSAGPIPYQYSDDAGDSWSDAVDVSDDDGFDREWIDARPDGTVYTTWRDDRGLVFRASHDGGMTWEKAVEFDDDTLEGPVTHDPSSSWVYIPYIGGPGKIVLARSSNEVDWDTVDAAQAPTSTVIVGNGATSIFPVAAVDSNGTIYLVYSADSQMLPAEAPKTAARFGIYLTVSQDHGDTWTEPTLISNPDKAAIMPWIAAGKPGRVAIVWYQNQNGAPNEMAPDVWDVHLWESVTADRADLASVEVLLNTEPAHVGGICSGGGSCLLTGGDRTQLDLFEVALTTDGHAVVTWAQSLPYTYPANILVGSPAPQVTIMAGGAVGTPLL